MPQLPFRRFRAVFDFRQQRLLNPNALVRNLLLYGWLLRISGLSFPQPE
jgi:hypothetical protein